MQGLKYYRSVGPHPVTFWKDNLYSLLGCPSDKSKIWIKCVEQDKIQYGGQIGMGQDKSVCQSTVLVRQGTIWLPVGSRFSLKMCSGNWNFTIGSRLAPKILRILLLNDRSNSLNFVSGSYQFQARSRVGSLCPRLKWWLYSVYGSVTISDVNNCKVGAHQQHITLKSLQSGPPPHIAQNVGTVIYY